VVSGCSMDVGVIQVDGVSVSCVCVGWWVVLGRQISGDRS